MYAYFTKYKTDHKKSSTMIINQITMDLAAVLELSHLLHYIWSDLHTVSQIHDWPVKQLKLSLSVNLDSNVFVDVYINKVYIRYKIKI